MSGAATPSRRRPRRRLTLALTSILGLLAWTPPGLSAQRYASLVADADTGEVLHAVDATVRWHPASLTKMMTLYLIFDAIETQRLTLADRLTVSAHVASQQPVKLGLRAGEMISVEDAIVAVVTRSANDAAVALAEAVASSESAFAEFMTAEAEALGMTASVFRNASGLPHPEQTTTARDMAVLARALMHDFPQHYHFFAARSFRFGGRELPTINGLLVSYPGADGIKTGFTCGSGYNLVASVLRDGRRLIGVVLGGSSTAGRNSEMAELLDDAFAGRSVRPGGDTTLAGLEDLVGASDAPPPQRLSPNECEAAGTMRATIGPGNAGTVRFSGWGILLGAFPAEGKAMATIKRARDSLRAVGTRGRAAVVRRQYQGITVHNALLVGLDRKGAGAACKHLRSAGAYCVAISPEALNNPNAVWR